MRPRLLMCVDMGTTRTRAWLMQGQDVLDHASADFGVRDVAGGKDPEWLRALLSGLLRDTVGVRREKPEALLAAGMITSPQGLREVPHVQTPVDVDMLAARLCAESIALPSGESLPLLLVPGVRTGGPAETPQEALAQDVMRGEETLCVGLMSQGKLGRDRVLLNLGSHWKAIWTDDSGRITRSRTALTGEMIHAIQSHTLLAASLPQGPPLTLDESWSELGFQAAKCEGLGRALFGTRLLMLDQQGTKEDRLAYVYGAFLHGELEALKAILRPDQEVLFAGRACVAELWQRYAQRRGIRCRILSEPEQETAYLRGLLALYERSPFSK